MTKVTLEFASADHAWLQFHCDLKTSQRGNYYVTHADSVYVFRNLKEGCAVLSKIDEQWQCVGRISGHKVFVGSKEQQSSTEYMSTPEARASALADLKSFASSLKTL